MPKLRESRPSKAKPKSISIIIPTRDKVSLLKTAKESLEKSGLDLEFIILDNQSVLPESAKYLQSLDAKNCRVIRCEYGFNFSRLCNEGARFAKSDYLIFMNNDCELLRPDNLNQIIDLLDEDSVGTVGPKYLSRAKGPSIGLQLGLGGIAGAALASAPASNYIYEVDLNTFAFLATKKDVFLSVGALDETFPVGLNDVDFGIRVLQQGYKNLALESLEVSHDEYGSRAKLNSIKGQIRAVLDVILFLRKWPNYSRLVKTLSLVPRR